MLQCGLLGKTLGHSYSPAIHARFGDYEYKLYEKTPEELDDFLKNGDFDGLNVTIPYKKAVMPYCAQLSETAARIGSVNTLIRGPDGSLYGDNTDAYGFARMVARCGVEPRGKKALIFGSGGASVTAQDVLRGLGAEVVVISRNGADNYDNLVRHADAALLVNTTPLGMYPNTGASPVELSRFPQCRAVLDVVYNPARTALLLQAETLGIPHANGLLMLVAQAARSSEQFTGDAISEEKIEVVTAELARQMENIVLIGMPGCGKSTVGKALSERLGRTFVDADTAIERVAGMPIPAIFRDYGEACFRDLEASVLAELGKQSGLVIATGGGCILREENYTSLHQNGRILWLRRALDALPTEGRPLSQTTDLRAMYEIRAPRYARFADMVVENDAELSEVLMHILEELS